MKQEELNKKVSELLTQYCRENKCCVDEITFTWYGYKDAENYWSSTLKQQSQ